MIADSDSTVLCRFAPLQGSIRRGQLPVRLRLLKFLALEGRTSEGSAPGANIVQGGMGGIAVGTGVAVGSGVGVAVGSGVACRFRCCCRHWCRSSESGVAVGSARWCSGWFRRRTGSVRRHRSRRHGRVFVGGTGVFVGGTGVFVGGTGVFVGGTGVFVGGTGIFVGGTAVGAGVTWFCAVTGSSGSPLPSSHATTKRR